MSKPYKIIKAKDIKRNWHLLDANNKILGRISTQIATLLMGKNKSYYTPNLDTGDFVVVINAQKVLLSGKKEKQKNYFRHSGYPGGLYVKNVAQLRSQKPEMIIKKAVVGMVPKTTLGKQMVKKLYIYRDENHPYQAKFKQ